MDRVLSGVDHIWAPDAAPHHLVYGMSGSGKTTLVKGLLGLCEHECVLVLDPKPATTSIPTSAARWPGWSRPGTVWPSASCRRMRTNLTRSSRCGHLKQFLATLAKRNLSQLTALVKTRLKRMQYRPGLLNGFLASTRLDLTPFL
jgi:energy-coupling factor transporter ATP-binding protein EcfA2